jgi:hypothetical protein
LPTAAEHDDARRTSAAVGHGAPLGGPCCRVCERSCGILCCRRPPSQTLCSLALSLAHNGLPLCRRSIARRRHSSLSLSLSPPLSLSPSLATSGCWCCCAAARAAPPRAASPSCERSCCASAAAAPGPGRATPGPAAWASRCTHSARPAPARPFPSSIFLDKNSREIGKSQSIWTDSKMETAGSLPWLGVASSPAARQAGRDHVGHAVTSAVRSQRRPPPPLARA